MIWGLFTVVLIKTAKKKYYFDVMDFHDKIDRNRLLIAVALAILGIVTEMILEGRFKPVYEFEKLAFVEFIFQYVYYLFEVAIFILIIIFGQKFGEMIFRNTKIPWGGFMLSLTWGGVHFFTQGIETGIALLIYAVLYGTIYLLVKKNFKLSYLLIACMFLL